jgi:outer membrane protein OmpA-like peptidoglycan-associated protein
MAAIRGKPGQWTIDNKNLHASENISPAPFTSGDVLPAFLKSFYDTPVPGTFSIDLRKGPQIKAYATPAMVSNWLALLQPVSGSTPVSLGDITYLPSIHHFPGYKPESVLAPGVEAESLRALLKNQQIYFASGSSAIEPAEQVKLGPLVFAINSAGPDASFIIAGYADIGGETATYKDVIKGLRATAVKKLLLRLGVSSDNMEIQAFDATRPGEVITEEGRRLSRRVEVLLK